MFSVMSVCLSVCLYLSICVSVCSGYSFWTTLHRDFILVCRYILTISRSSLSIKVIGSRSRSYEKSDSFTYFNFLILCMWLQVINKVKVTHQGEGHIKVKVKYLHPFKSYVADTLRKWVVCIRLNAFLFLLCSEKSQGHKLSWIRSTWNLVIWALNSL